MLSSVRRSNRAGLTIVPVAVALLLAAGCARVRFQPSDADGFVLRTDGDHRYYVYVPSDWRPTEKWPIIVFLHGGDERGTDPVRPTQVGLGPVVQATHGRFPAIVLFPQCAPGRFWAMPDQEARVLRAIDAAIAEWNGDPTRVTMTGNSMGGYGSWIIGAKHPEHFAALAPICGGVRPPRGVPLPPEAPSFAREPDPEAAVARRLIATPVWAFHGANDWVVPVEKSRRLVAAMRAAGAPIRYTEYRGVGHNSWDRAYAEPDLLPWLLQQKRADERPL
jgi:predicted peptidase